MGAQVSILLHLLAAVAVSARVLLRPRMEPTVRLAWILVVIAVPLVGVLGYLFFGEIRMNRGERQRRARTRARLTGLWAPSPEQVKDPPSYAAPVLAVGRAVGGFEPVSGNDTHLLPEDDSAILELCEAIDQANEHVHVLFYIWLPDKSGQLVAEAMMRAAQRGVAVRILVDAVGSRLLVKSPLWTAMQGAGARCHTAEPLRLPLMEALFQRVDLRNHRKIVVIDHALGFTGSRNCSDMAFAIKPRFAPWVDIFVRAKGPVVRQMQAIFLQDWMSATGEDLGMLLTLIDKAAEDTDLCQIIATGPDLSNGSLADCMATLIYAASESVTIATPYYVPEPSLDSAIRSAARRGVNVTMIVPARNDSLLVGAASEGFFGALTQAGVRLMLFQPGLLHAKIITVDGRMTMIGSANMDRRSFELNYEMNMMVVDDEFTAELDERLASYIARARPLTMQQIERWPVWRRVRNNLLAIASPLL